MESVSWKTMMHWAVEHPGVEFKDTTNWTFRLKANLENFEVKHGDTWMPYHDLPRASDTFLIPIEVTPPEILDAVIDQRMLFYAFMELPFVDVIPIASKLGTIVPEEDRELNDIDKRKAIWDRLVDRQQLKDLKIAIEEVTHA